MRTQLGDSLLADLLQDVRFLRVYKRKNVQVLTGLQLGKSCYKSGCSQVVNKLCSHCLFPVVEKSLEQAVNNL